MPSTLVARSVPWSRLNAQEILVGLAVAAVLGHDESGHGLQQLASPQDRAGFELRTRDRTLGRRFHVAYEFSCRDHHFTKIVGGQACGE